MKSNKGFTLIELIASFSLALVIMFFLFQIVITVKELYISSGVKTEMLIRQANLERQIESDLRDKGLVKVNNCGEACYTFTYGDGSTKNLKVEHSSKKIQYGTYQVPIQDGSIIGEFTLDNHTVPNVAVGKKNTILIIDLPITNKVVSDKNFGLHLIYQYDNRSIHLGL